MVSLDVSPLRVAFVIAAASAVASHFRHAGLRPPSFRQVLRLQIVGSLRDAEMGRWISLIGSH